VRSELHGVTVSPERLVCDAIHGVDAHGGVPRGTFSNYSQWTTHKWVGQPNASFRPVTDTVFDVSPFRHG
jgi:hypothetical protein